MKEPLIHLHSVGKYFVSRNHSAPLWATRDLSLQVKPTEFVSIIGPSGCGKTTLLRLIGGLQVPSSGKVTIKGKTAVEARKCREFGFVFQNPVLFPWRTVLKNIALPGEIFKSEKIKKHSRELVDLVGLTGFERAFPAQLSGGMQSRVSIARALASNPSILLMDEPFGSLDELTRDKMNLELIRIWENTRTTVTFITHSIPEAVFLSDKVAVMSPRPGKIESIIEIDLPRPRPLEIRDSEKFTQLVKQLRSLLE